MISLFSPFSMTSAPVSVSPCLGLRRRLRYTSSPPSSSTAPEVSRVVVCRLHRRRRMDEHYSTDALTECGRAKSLACYPSPLPPAGPGRTPERSRSLPLSAAVRQGGRGVAWSAYHFVWSSIDIFGGSFDCTTDRQVARD